MFLPLGTPLEPQRESAIYVSDRTKWHTRATLSIGGPLYKSATGVVGAQLDHFPDKSIRGLRAGQDTAQLRRIEREMAPLYPRQVARFVANPRFSNYSTEPFPDPNQPI